VPIVAPIVAVVEGGKDAVAVFNPRLDDAAQLLQQHRRRPRERACGAVLLHVDEVGEFDPEQGRRQAHS
jgi:hypothetical protein